jgi:hypothetical protein
VPRVLLLLVAVIAAVSVSSVRAQDATPDVDATRTAESAIATADVLATEHLVTATADAVQHEATWSYWETVESVDLTQVAEEQAAVETEQALPPVSGDAELENAQAATQGTTVVAVTQLPDAGTGSSSGSMAAVLAVLGVLLSGAWLALRRTA